MVSVIAKYGRMGNKRVILIICVLCFSCIRHSDESGENQEYWPNPSQKSEIHYAKGFDIQYQADLTLIITQSLSGNTPFKDSLYLPYNKNAAIPKTAKVLQYEKVTVACQSSTHLAFLKKLKELDKLKGVCGMEYIEDRDLLSDLEKKAVREICIGEALQKETLLELSPDLYLIYPFSSEEKDQIEKDGIKTLMIGEYLETHPLARLEWIKLFGEIYSKNDMASQYFDEVEKEYNSLKIDQPDTSKKFIFNVPYGDSWYTPSSNSLVVTLLEDAGLYYYFQNEIGTENTPHTKEEIWLTGENVPYWVIIASRPDHFTLNDLIEEEPVYKTFKSVKNGNVIFCNTATSNYFIDGVVEPHVMLRELKSAVNGEIINDPHYFEILR